MNTEEVNIYISAMSMENSLLQSYRTLFLAIEAALFAANFALNQFSAEKFITGIEIAGLIIGFMWIIVCHAKGKDVDKWKTLLLEETEKEDCFSYMESRFSLAGGKVARYWFNWIMPVLVILLWVYIMVKLT